MHNPIWDMEQTIAHLFTTYFPYTPASCVAGWEVHDIVAAAYGIIAVTVAAAGWVAAVW